MRWLGAALFSVLLASPVLAQPVATQWEYPLRIYDFNPAGTAWGSCAVHTYCDVQPNWPEYYSALKKYHLGADINVKPDPTANPPETGSVDCGEAVYPVATGTVVFAGDGGTDWGKVVVIKHNLGSGRYVSSLYGHLKTINTTWAYPGSEVEPDVVIGEIGSADSVSGSCGSNPHLHFEIRQQSAKSTVKATCPAGTTTLQCVGRGYVASLTDPLLEEYTDPSSSSSR